MVEVEEAFIGVMSDKIKTPEPMQGDCSKESIMVENIKTQGDVTTIQNTHKHKQGYLLSIKTKNPISSTFTKRLDLDHLNQLLENWQFRQSILPDFGFDHFQ